MEDPASLAIDAHQGNVLVLPSNRRDFNDTVLDFPIIRGFCGRALAFGVDPCADDSVPFGSAKNVTQFVIRRNVAQFLLSRGVRSRENKASSKICAAATERFKLWLKAATDNINKVRKAGIPAPANRV